MKRKSTVSSKRRHERPITIRDVAKRAAVSIATVSRVLNKPECVEATKRARVQKIMRDLDFSPNIIAASLARNRSECIGLILPNLSPVFSPLVDEVERVVNARGGYLIVATGKTHADDVKHSVRFLRQRRCDALIVFPGTMSDLQVSEMLDAERNAIVLHRSVPGYPERCVLVDNGEGARIAVRYLIDCGHRDIAVITGPDYSQESGIRYDAFVETMTAAGLPVDPNLVVSGNFDVASGENGVMKLFSSGRSFSALFCFNDEMAIGAISYLGSAGVSLPRDLSIIGFDDIQNCRQVSPRLTSIHQPIVDMGRIAAQRALALSAGEPMPGETSPLKPRLVIRSSVLPRRATTGIQVPGMPVLIASSG